MALLRKLQSKTLVRPQPAVSFAQVILVVEADA